MLLGSCNLRVLPTDSIDQIVIVIHLTQSSFHVAFSGVNQLLATSTTSMQGQEILSCTDISLPSIML